MPLGLEGFVVEQPEEPKQTRLQDHPFAYANKLGLTLTDIWIKCKIFCKGFNILEHHCFL